MKVQAFSALQRFSSEKMVKAPVMDSPHCFCDLYCLMPGQSQKVHDHPGSDKVYYVVECSGTFHIDGEEQSVSAGNAVVAPAGSQHGVRNETAENLTLYVVMAPRP